MKTVFPPLVSSSAVESLERKILAYLKKEIYQKLIDAIPFLTDELVMDNAKDDLLSAIRRGTIVFYRGEFRGEFNAAISKEIRDLGGKWDSERVSYRLPSSELPVEIKQAVQVSANQFYKATQSLNAALEKILPQEFKTKPIIENFFNTQLFKLDKEVDNVLRGITVAPKLTLEEKFFIADSYSNNLDLYIKKFSVKQIKTIRKEVQQAYFSGNRYQNMVKTIQHNYEVTESKAKFLARNETRLMSAKFNEARMTSAGAKGYIWTTVGGTPAHPVREGHKRLNGKRFTFANPPIVDEKTGRRANPGEDYNCRCRAKVVFS